MNTFPHSTDDDVYLSADETFDPKSFRSEHSGQLISQRNNSSYLSSPLHLDLNLSAWPNSKPIADQSAGGLDADIDDFDDSPSQYSTPRETTVEQSLQESRKLFDKLASSVSDASFWGGWKNTLSTITSSVGEGFTSVLETVESSLNIPEPEDLASLPLDERLQLEKKANEIKEPLDEWDSCDDLGSDAGSAGSDAWRSQDDASSGYQSDSAKVSGSMELGKGFLGHWTSVLEHTGKQLMSGGIDALENLGKKTYEALTEQDTETAKRRLKFKPNQPTLSQLLREVKSLPERQDSGEFGKGELRLQPITYTFLFEEAQGGVSLEALTMLSQNCAHVLQESVRRLPAEQRAELSALAKEWEGAIRTTTLTSRADEEAALSDFALTLHDILISLGLKLDVGRLLDAQSKHHSVVTNCRSEQQHGARKQSEDIYEQGLRCLADLTSCCIELVHKLGQLALAEGVAVSGKPLSKLVELLMNELSAASSQFAQCLDTAAAESEHPDEVSRLMTNLFFEASNSATFVQEAFQLVLPVVQVAFLQHLANREK